MVSRVVKWVCMNIGDLKSGKSLFEVYGVSLLLLLFTIRLSVPYSIYVLFPALAIGLVYIIYSIVNIGLLNFFMEFGKPFLLFFAAYSLYFFGFLLTPDKNLFLIKELLHTSSIFVVLYVILLACKSFGNFDKIFGLYIKQVIVISAVIGIVGLLKFAFSLFGIQFGSFYFDGIYATGSTIVADRNFYNVLFFISIIFIFKKLLNDCTKIKSYLYQLILLILTLNIVLSTSRRALIVFIVIFSCFLLTWVISFVIRSKILINFRRNIQLYVFVVLFLFSLSFFYIFFVPSIKKNEYLIRSSFDSKSVQGFINSWLFEYNTIVNDTANYYEIRNSLWNSDFDPRYPYSGWGTGEYELVTNITGKNHEIVPNGSYGYKLNRKANCSPNNGIAHFYSKVNSIILEPGKRYMASVYCFVSEDFNGDDVFLSALGKIEGQKKSSYNLRRKGEWQRINTIFYGDSVNSSVYLNFIKYNTNDFSNLEGFVVFAYPDIVDIKFDPKKPSTWAGNSFIEVSPIVDNSKIFPDSTIGCRYDASVINSLGEEGTLMFSNVFDYVIPRSKRAINSIYVYVSYDFNGNKAGVSQTGNAKGNRYALYNLNNKGTWQRLTINAFGDSARVKFNMFFEKKDSKSVLNGHIIFAYPSLDYVVFDAYNPKTWVSGNYSEKESLIGTPLKSISADIVGFKIDKTLTAFEGKNGSNIDIPLFVYTPKEHLRVISSVYAYVSADFNGDEVILKTSGKIKGSRVFLYDLERKGTWQKLFINCYGTDKDCIIDFRISKSGVPDFSSLQGYVVLAYPEFKRSKFDPKNPYTYATRPYKREYPLTGRNVEIVPVNCAGYKLDSETSYRQSINFVHSTTIYSESETKIGDVIRASVFCYVSDDFNGNSAKLGLSGDIVGKKQIYYDLKKKGAWQRLEIEVTANGGIVKAFLFFSQKDVKDFSTLKGHVIFAYPQFEVIKASKDIGQSSLKSESVFYLLSKASIIPSFTTFADTTEIPDEGLDEVVDNAETEFQKEYERDKFAGARLDRWRYAWFLYTKEYSWWQRIFGGGLGYTRSFAKTFNSPIVYDYPHNPVLSMLLYAGIIGVVVYFWLLIKTVYLYWIYRHEYWYVFICFVIIYFFSFFSANTLYDPPVLAFFIVFPFIVDYYKKKDRISNE